MASGFNPATIIGILCVYGYRDERFDRDYLLNVLRDYISAEEKTVRRDERLESELRVLQMMVEKATASRRKHHRHTILPAPIPASAPTLTPPFPPLVFVDSEWVNATRINDPDRPSAFAFDDFLLPPEWDGTAQPMPESNDWEGWTNVMAYVSGVEESRMS